MAKEKKQVTIEDLPGVGPTTAQKLIEFGYTDLMSIATASPKELEQVAGFTALTARKVINTARDSLDMGFESGDQLLKRRSNLFHLTTGSSNFDTMLGGGLESGSITECFGEFSTGKTNLGHVLCVNLQKQFPGAVAVYIDTENTFRPERIAAISKGAGIEPNDVLSKIKVAKAYNSDHQMLLLEKVESLIKDDKLNIKIVIVDSLTAHFRAEFVGRGTLADRQQKLNKHLHAMTKLADVYNVIVYVTNQVMSKPDTFFGDPTQSVGGHIVNHSTCYRIYLRKGKKGSKVAKLVDAPHLPDAEANFMIDETGIKDV